MVAPFLARTLALELMTKHGLHEWVFRFNKSKRRAGVCFFPLRNGVVVKPGRIELSVHHCELNDIEVVTDTLLHEIAHALAGEGHGHDDHWKAICVRIGAKPERCYGTDAVVMPTGRWRGRCGTCQKEYHRHRKPKSLEGYWCLACGREAGKFTWVLTTQ